jgi:DNA-binding CsgD family transcriptional regulator
MKTVDRDIILTKRENEILHYVSEGYTIKELANKLNISSTTVIFHRNNLRKKFNARNSIDLISKAFKNKIL